MLPTGRRLGAFEVLTPLGTGGMGEVYRARDGKLGRDVALKVLSGEVSASPARLARFEQEARLLAALNHPGIAAIYGFEEVDHAPVLVLELVEGHTLTERLHKGPLKVLEALDVGRQVAEALAAAHERSIIHRDLKPSNIKVTPEGKVKLLDFGLAKALQDESAADLVSKDSTETPATAQGTVLGTVPYMSPEQARGQVVDKRTDVWAFGCLLYELLSGRRAFAGTTGADTVAAILEREPDWSALPTETPPSVRALLRRCLQKDRAERLHDIGDARLELKDALAGPLDVRAGLARGRPSRPALLGAGVVAVLAAGALIAVATARRQTATPYNFTIVPPRGVSLHRSSASMQHVAVSATGDWVVFRGVPSDGKRRAALYVRRIQDIEARMLPGTEGAYTPFSSPDGRWVGFSQRGHLRKLLLDGGSQVEIAILTAGDSPTVRGASWGTDGTIVFAPDVAGGLWQVSASGGTPRPLTTLNAARAEKGHRWPQVLPGGRAALFTVQPHSLLARDARIEAVDLETGERHVLLEGSGFARCCPSGYLVYARLGTILAAPFDLEALRINGPAVPVLEDVQMDVRANQYASFDVSASGTLVYIPGYPRAVARSLLWVDRDGSVRAMDGPKRDYGRPRLSPNGRRLAAEVTADDSVDIWRVDLERGAWTRMTFDGRSGGPEWSPDRQSVAFDRVSKQGEGILRMAADEVESAKPLNRVPLGDNITLNGWSPDGRFILFQEQMPVGLWDLEVLPLEAGGPPRFLLDTPNTECAATISPDGRWLAYASDETGPSEVYVRSFVGSGHKQAISAGGGFQPRWSRAGDELFYRSIGDRPKLMAVAVKTGGSFQAGAARPLFDDVFAGRETYLPPNYDVSPDRQRFVFVEEPAAAPAPSQLVLIPEWSRELEEKGRGAPK